MTVLLLEPIVQDVQKWGSFQVEKGFIPPIGMISLYSYLKSKDLDVLFVDTQFKCRTEVELAAFLREHIKIDIIGIPVFTNTASNSFRTAKLCKEVRPDVTIVLGGVHATSMPKQTLGECPEADYIVLGEGEKTLLELVTALRGKQPVEKVDGIAFRKNGEYFATRSRSLIENLDDLPMPRYEDLDLARYVPHPTQYCVLPNFPMVTQRGCPYRCSFCEASLIHGKKVRRFSVARVIKELEILKSDYGARGIYFHDSTFTIDNAYATQLMKSMIARKLNLKWACNTRCDKVDPELLALMRRAGCWMISYGIESANQQSLDILQKGITLDQIESSVRETKKAGIAILASFILALPGEDASMVKNTIRFAKKLLPNIALFYLPVPYPGSALYQTCKRTHGLREDAKWEDYLSVDFNNPVYENPILKKEQMRHFYKSAYREFYRNPRYIIKMMFSIKSMNDVRRYWRGFRAVVHAFFKKTDE